MATILPPPEIKGRYKKLVKRYQDGKVKGCVGLSGDDDVSSYMEELLKQIDSLLSLLPNYDQTEARARFMLPFVSDSKFKRYKKASKQIMNLIELGHEKMTTTEQNRDNSEPIAQFLTSRKLGGYKDGDVQFKDVMSLLYVVADSGLSICHRISDDLVKAPHPGKKKGALDFGELKTVSELASTLLSSIMERIQRVPYLADEFVELIRQMAVVFHVMTRTMFEVRRGDMTSENLVSIVAELSRTIMCLGDHLAILEENQDDRILKLGDQYKLSQNIRPLNTISEPITLASALEELNVPRLHLEIEKLTELPATGFSVVSKVQLSNGTEVAVKKFMKEKSDIADERMCLRIMREASMLQATRRSETCDKIVELRGFWVDPGSSEHGAWPRLVTDWYEGGCLWEYLRQDKIIPLREKLKYVLDAAEGISFLHKLSPQIIHCDIKTDNILLRDGGATLTDFGSSRVIDNIERYRTQTSGSGSYMAPELRLKLDCFVTLRNPNCTTDMYAFGSVFLEVIRQERPYAWITEEKKLEEVCENGLTPYDIPPPGAPPRRPIPDPLVQSMLLDRLSPVLGSPLFNEPHPKYSEEPEKVFCPMTEHWEFMKLCWSPNPWRRPTASEAVVQLREFLKDCPP